MRSLCCDQTDFIERNIRYEIILMKTAIVVETDAFICIHCGEQLMNDKQMAYLYSTSIAKAKRRCSSVG